MKKLLIVAAVVVSAAVAYAQDVSGVWQGTLQAGGKDLRIAFRITRADGGFRAQGFSIDQGNQAMPVSVTQEGATVRLAMVAIGASYEGRLSADGALDLSFQPPQLDERFGLLSVPTTADAEGRLYLGGSFTAVNGTPRLNFARLLPDGGVDASFAASESIPGGVRSVFVSGIGFQSDGKVVIVGDFLVPATAPSSQRVAAPVRHDLHDVLEPVLGIARIDPLG